MAHESDPNDDLVEFQSCAGGFLESKFGGAYHDRFYGNKLHHQDMAFLVGDSLLDDANKPGDKSTLTFEVYSNESGDELLGSGQLDVTSLVQKYTTEPEQETIRLDGNRGEVIVDVWFGPPVRKAFRAAARTTKLLDARDAFVSTVCGVLSGICAVVSRYVLMPTMDFANKHRKLSMALAALLSIMAGTMVMIFLAVAVRAGLVAFFTFLF
ncbi:hypothetical protein PsorP6_012188 [Peronosclerospora sorghi]|uniref:Uncharacterized protein n=1 Tax=Peronosclerospora sorghi TaxID=230839 RepID=A0ACC0WHL6_9STRA|nr:hypothetical protein PsorP6_012188 [Peronosclerospora sorghi]